MVDDSTTSGFLVSLGLSLAVSIISIVLFSFIRNRFRDIYQYRRLIHQWKSFDDFNNKRVGIPSHVPTKQPFSWISAALSITEEEIVQKVGLDTAMYLRYMRSMIYSFGIVSVLATLILIPVYGTGNYMARKNELSENIYKTNTVSGLKIISLSNVIPGDPRMWATLVIEILASLVFIFFMFHDYAKFSELRRKNLSSENPKNYAIAVYDVPANKNETEHIREKFETIVPGQVAEVLSVRDCSKLRKLAKSLDNAVFAREKSEWISATKLDGKPNQGRVGPLAPLRFWDSSVNTNEHWTNEEQRIKADIVETVVNSRMSHSSLVLFKNKRAASLLVQANMAEDNTQWNIGSMPEPKGVNWSAFCIPHYQAQIRRISVFVFVVSLTLLWSIPAFGLASLISLDRAAEEFEFLKPVLNWNRELKGLVQGLLPTIILSVIVALIPIVIRFAVLKERIHSIHVIDRKTRDYFYFFTIYSSFFCIVLGASILDEIKLIATNFDLLKVFDLLGSSIPAQGIFFATYIVIQTGIGTSLELVNPIRLVLVGILKKMAKTEREKRAAQGHGCEPELFKMYGRAMLISFIGIVYLPMFPLIPVLTTIFFAYTYLVHRYNLSYNLYSESDGGGESYPGAFWGTMLALSLRSGVTTVILGLKRSGAASLSVIPLIIVICAGLYIGKRFSRSSKFGTLHDLFMTEDQLPDRYLSIYDHPFSKPKEYLNLNGVAEIADYHEKSRNIPNDF